MTWYLEDFWMEDEFEADEDIKNNHFDVVNNIGELEKYFDNLEGKE